MSKIIKSFRVIEDDSTFDEYEAEEEINEETIEEIKLKIEAMIEESKLEAEEIVDKAELEAREIIAKAKIEAKKIVDDVEQDLIVIKEQARQKGYDSGSSLGYEDGYKEGYKKGEDESNILIEEAVEIKDKYILERKNMLEELEPEVIELIIYIYNKVIGNRLENDDEYILELVSNGLRNLDPTEKLTIIVSKDDYEILLENKNKILAEASLINELEVKYDINLVTGDCILETPKGNVDLSVKDQLKEVDNMLRKILNNE